jgi:hypothetical protein
MRSPTWKRPSLGTILGLTALVVAVVGTASATPSRTIIRKGDLAKGSVTARALAKGAVKAAAIAKGSVTARAVGKGAVGSAALSANAVNSTALAPSSIYGGALGPAIVRTAPIPDLDVSADLSNWTFSGPVVATCETGQRPVSGGVVFTNAGNGRVAVAQSGPTDGGWVGGIATDSGGTAKAEVQVLCLK